MADLPTTLADNVKGLAVDYIKQVTESIRTGMGGRASDAQPMSEAEELEGWMRATATPEQIAQFIAAGDDDDAVFQKSRKYRYALGKAAAKGDPIKEVEYHEKMRAKADAFMAEQMARTQPEPMAGAGEGSSNDG